MCSRMPARIRTCWFAKSKVRTISLRWINIFFVRDWLQQVNNSGLNSILILDNFGHLAGKGAETMGWESEAPSPPPIFIVIYKNEGPLFSIQKGQNS